MAGHTETARDQTLQIEADQLETHASNVIGRRLRQNSCFEV